VCAAITVKKRLAKFPTPAAPASSIHANLEESNECMRMIHSGAREKMREIDGFVNKCSQKNAQKMYYGEKIK
jgi:hypothetical protein